MPRVSRRQTDRNRREITDVSARLFRERGIQGVSVADLMAAAGLTHGGFYGHFASKDALAAAACAAAFERSIERWSRHAADGGRGVARTALIEGFLCAQSRASPGSSCPAAGLVVDVAREPADAPVRDAYLAGLKGLLDILASLQQSGEAAADRRAALADFATMVGALVLSRATAGDPLSDELLAAARARLEPPCAPARRRPTARRARAPT